MPQHLAAVIYVKDLAASGRFYQAIARLAVTESETGHIVLEADGFQLALVAMPAPLAAAVEVTDPPQRRENTPIKLVFFVADMAAARERVAALGGQLNPAEREWTFQGYRVCDGHDVEGNVFQLREKAQQ